MHRGRTQFLVLIILLHQALIQAQVYGQGIPSSCHKLEIKYKRSMGIDASDAIHIPESLQVPADHKLRLCYLGQGVQKYKFNGTEWINFNASAVLHLGGQNRIGGRHFYLAKPDNLGGQPTWETFSSWSTVTGKALEKTSVRNDAIAWVLLQSTHSSGSGKRFGQATYIQRLFTVGGLPPNTTSLTGAVTGQYFESPYTAVYAYYTKQ
ncbi:hypothetical protein R1sor_010383 [Riccia sorocarpa]|uniref:DUF3455 domain-containing protein n=1 Tax=Riccia sorocarpa TaxID=122646 RepID=A0ABD3I0L1_9MARC